MIDGIFYVLDQRNFYFRDRQIKRSNQVIAMSDVQSKQSNQAIKLSDGKERWTTLGIYNPGNS